MLRHLSGNQGDGTLQERKKHFEKAVSREKVDIFQELREGQVVKVGVERVAQRNRSMRRSWSPEISKAM